MTDDQLLEGTCECGEKGTIGEVCDICGGVFAEGNSEYDDFEEDDDSYSKDEIKKTKNEDVISLEEAEAESEDEEY